MGASQVSRSQSGARAEARRRIAERARKAEVALTEYLRAGEQIAAANKLIAAHQAAQRRALSDLVDVIGPEQAAAAAGVDLKLAKSAAGSVRHGSAAADLPSQTAQAPQG